MTTDPKQGLQDGVYIVEPIEVRKSIPDANDLGRAQHEEDPPVDNSIPMKLKHLQRTTSGIKFMLSAIELIFYSPGCSAVWILLLMAASTMCIYFGYIYDGACTRCPSLKDILIIFGSFGVTKCALGIVEQVCMGLGCGNEMGDADEKEGHQRHVCLAFVDKIFSVLLLLSFLVMCLEVYSNLVDDYQTIDKHLPAYCDYLLVTFSMWFCNSMFIFMVLSLILIIVLISLAK